MADCLKSPQLSAHLLTAQRQSDGLQPTHGRPRARTAPPTPMVEVPATATSPVELPGSIPAWAGPNNSRLSIDGRTAHNTASIREKVSYGRHTEMTDSKDANRAQTYPTQQSCESFRRQVASLRTLGDPMDHTKSENSLNTHEIAECAEQRPWSDRTSDSTTSTIQRPSLSVAPVRRDQVR